MNWSLTRTFAGYAAVFVAAFFFGQATRCPGGRSADQPPVQRLPTPPAIQRDFEPADQQVPVTVLVPKTEKAADRFAERWGFRPIAQQELEMRRSPQEPRADQQPLVPGPEGAAGQGGPPGRLLLAVGTVPYACWGGEVACSASPDTGEVSLDFILDSPPFWRWGGPWAIDGTLGYGALGLETTLMGEKQLAESPKMGMSWSLYGAGRLIAEPENAFNASDLSSFVGAVEQWSLHAGIRWRWQSQRR